MSNDKEVYDLEGFTNSQSPLYVQLEPAINDILEFLTFKKNHDTETNVDDLLRVVSFLNKLPSKKENFKEIITLYKKREIALLEVANRFNLTNLTLENKISNLQRELENTKDTLKTLVERSNMNKSMVDQLKEETDDMDTLELLDELSELTDKEIDDNLDNMNNDLLSDEEKQILNR